MAVIVQQDGKSGATLYIKGADSVICERLAPTDWSLLLQTKKFADEASIYGYRTLFFAKRELTLEELT